MKRRKVAMLLALLQLMFQTMKAQDGSDGRAGSSSDPCASLTPQFTFYYVNLEQPVTSPIYIHYDVNNATSMHVLINYSVIDS